jgi:aspartate kinase
MSSQKRKKLDRCIVVKFGGSSLANKTKIDSAAKAVAKEVSKGTRIAVVVSAIGKTTDFLLDTTKQASRDKITDEELDDILLDPLNPDWPIITDKTFTNAKPILSVCEKLIKKHVSPSIGRNVVVIPGFIGKTEDGKITTLGRGGSDTTALIIARALSADQMILVTNVDGIMSADPKIIKKPQLLKEIHVNTLTGLTDSGTKFIHKKALKYKDPSIGVKVINNTSGDLDSDGTIVHGNLSNSMPVEMSAQATTAVTIVGKAISESPQILQEVLQQINNVNVPILGISIDYNSLILYLPSNGIEELLEALHSIVVVYDQTLALAVKQNLAFIRVRGVGLEETPGIISKLAESLYSARINIFGIFTITSSILVFVDFNDREKAIKLIQKSIKVDLND